MGPRSKVKKSMAFYEKRLPFGGQTSSLTPALCRWEREQLADGVIKFVSHTPEFNRGHAET
jgi:hypothetical protein